MEIDKEKLNQKHQETKTTSCDNVEIDNSYSDPGPIATVTEMGQDYAVIEGTFKQESINKATICYVEVLNNNNSSVFNTEDVNYHWRGLETIVVKFKWTDLEFDAWYSDYTMRIHYSLDNQHCVSSKPIIEFLTTHNQSAEPYLRVNEITDITATSASFSVKSYAGKDLNGNKYTWTDKILIRAINPNDPTAYSSEIPPAEKSSTVITLTNLKPGRFYFDYTVTDILSSVQNESLLVVNNVPSFQTLYENEKPSFTQKDLSIKDNDLTINYILDLGSDQNGDPYQLESNVELYDQDEKLLDSKNDSTATFNIEDLASGEYSGWYLSAKTNYDLKAITAVLDDFTIEASKIVEPSFSKKDLLIKDNDLTINYILDLGSDQNGDSYQLEADVELYDQDDKLLDSKSDSTGTFNIEDLENGKYSGWYLSAKTSYGVKAITAELDDFTIEASQTVVPFFSEKNLLIKDNDLTINYILDLGSDQNGDPYQLESNVELYDRDGNLLDSKSDSTATFSIEDLENGRYRGWYLSAKTSYALEKIITKLRPFIIRNSSSNIKPPYFKCNEIKVCQDLVEVSYKINSGKNQNGEEYKLIGLVVLVDDIGCVRAYCDKMEGDLIVNNLTPNTTYSNWYISAYTTYSEEEIVENLEKFQTVK